MMHNFSRGLKTSFRVQTVMHSRAESFAEGFEAVERRAMKERLPGILSDEGMQYLASTNYDRVHELSQAIATGGDSTQYLAAQLIAPRTTIGFARVETPKFKLPFKKTTVRVPEFDVYDPLHFPKGQISEIGGVMVYLALQPYSEKDKAIVVSEASNETTNTWLTSMDLAPNGNTVERSVNGEVITCLEFETQNAIFGTLEALRDRFECIQANGV